MKKQKSGYIPVTNVKTVSQKRLNGAIKKAWGNNYHWAYPCSDGWHDSFWKTVVESPQWLAWVKENQREPKFDIDECQECGWISQKHFQAFIKFIKNEQPTPKN